MKNIEYKKKILNIQNNCQKIGGDARCTVTPKFTQRLVI